MDLVSSFTKDVVKKALDGHSKRHVAISSNLANVDTPNYAKQSVSFENALGQAVSARRSEGQSYQRTASNDENLALKATHEKHLSASPLALSLQEISPEIEEHQNYDYRNDGNSVDVETEMVDLAENSLKYVSLTNIQGRMSRSVKTVLSSVNGV